MNEKVKKLLEEQRKRNHRDKKRKLHILKPGVVDVPGFTICGLKYNNKTTRLVASKATGNALGKLCKRCCKTRTKN